MKNIIVDRTLNDKRTKRVTIRFKEDVFNKFIKIQHELKNESMVQTIEDLILNYYKEK